MEYTGSPICFSAAKAAGTVAVPAALAAEKTECY